MNASMGWRCRARVRPPRSLLLLLSSMWFMSAAGASFNETSPSPDDYPDILPSPSPKTVPSPTPPPPTFNRRRLAPTLASSTFRFAQTTLADAIDVNGNLEQPFYNSGGESTWYELTFSNFALDFRATAGGTVLASSGDSDEASYRTFSTDTSQRNGTHGTISASRTAGDMTLVRSYCIDLATSMAMTVTITMTNNGATAVSSCRAWFGTRDDYIGGSDRPTKRTGSIANGTFVNSSSGGSTLEIKSGNEVSCVPRVES